MSYISGEPHDLRRRVDIEEQRRMRRMRHVKCEEPTIEGQVKMVRLVHASVEEPLLDTETSTQNLPTSNTKAYISQKDSKHDWGFPIDDRSQTRENYVVTFVKTRRSESCDDVWRETFGEFKFCEAPKTDQLFSHKLPYLNIFTYLK